MSYVVVGKREADDRWRVEVSDIGSTVANELGGIEAAARGVLRDHGVVDADSVDLQLLLPDFEVDLASRGVPDHGLRPIELVSGLIALVVVVGAVVFVLSRVLG